MWYPHYGASAIAAISETALFILSNVFIRKYGLFDLISLSIQGLRICTLVMLLSFYTTLWNRKSPEEDDEERQSLLPENSKPAGNGNGAGYGATTNVNDNSQDGNSSDSDEDDVLAKRRNKAQERVQKRLETDGNWWAYVKGFSVCEVVRLLFDFLTLSRFLFHMCGQSTIRLCNFAPSQWEPVF